MTYFNNAPTGNLATNNQTVSILQARTPIALFASIFVAIVMSMTMVGTSQASELSVNIQQEQIDNCIAGTLKYKIADEPTAKKLCSCTIGVRSKMTIGQMWEIESYAQSNKSPAELPYVIQLQKDLQQCTNGLTLNKPSK